MGASRVQPLIILAEREQSALKRMVASTIEDRISRRRFVVARAEHVAIEQSRAAGRVFVDEIDAVAEIASRNGDAALLVETANGVVADLYAA